MYMFEVGYLYMSYVCTVHAGTKRTLFLSLVYSFFFWEGSMLWKDDVTCNISDQMRNTEKTQLNSAL